MPLLESSITPLHPSEKDQSGHFKDWPNVAGFTAGTDQRTPKPLTVQGRFPAYAAGNLYRTGPGTYRTETKDGGDFKCSHWFDGFTYIHRFNMLPKKDGSCGVEYTSRCQVDKLVEKARSSGKLEGMTFAQKRDPCDSFFKKVKTAFESVKESSKEGGDYENVGVVIGKTPGKPSSSSLTVTTDASSIKELDPTTLEPLGATNQRKLHPELRGPLSAAHAGVDPVTGDLYNYNIELGRHAIWRVFKTDASTRDTSILATISTADVPELKAAYIHSLFLTKNYVVLCVWPESFTASGLSILWQQNFLDALRFDPSVKTQWIVVDRDPSGRGVVVRFTSNAIYAFHFVNGWEETNEQTGATDIVVDLVEYPNSDILHKFYYSNLVSNASNSSKWSIEANPNLKSAQQRYRLPSIPNSSASAPQKPLSNPRELKYEFSVPSPYSGELPRVRDDLMTARHRYVYAVGARDLSSFMDCLIKTDMEAAASISKTHTRGPATPDFSACAKVWEHHAHSPGEPIFVPDPKGTEEDDGVVLSVVLDGIKGTSYLLCLDARSMTEVGRAEVGMPVGFGFHGVYLPMEA